MRQGLAAGHTVPVPAGWIGGQSRAAQGGPRGATTPAPDPRKARRSVSAPVPIGPRHRNHPVPHSATRHGHGRAAAVDAAASPGPSAARLAAEALFGGPTLRPARQEAAPLVIVKRTRRAEPPPTADAPPAAGRAESHPGQGPRVFRLPAPDPAVAAAREAEPHGVALPRRRRRPDDHRPGPVLQVLAPPPPPSARPTPAAWQALADELAALAPVLAAIERAQAFQFRPDDQGDAWQRLQQQAQALAQELRRARR